MREISMRQELARMPVFKGMTEQQREILASRFKLLDFEEGEILYREGGSWDYVGFVLEGSVDGRVRNDKNVETLLGRTHARSAIGLFNLRANLRAPVTLAAATPLRIAAIAVKDLDELKRENPALVLLFYEGMIQHFADVSRRLATYISDVCPPREP